MAKTSSTAKGFALLSASGLIVKVLSLVYLPIQTAIVHDQGNAVINLGYQIYAFIFSFSNAGLPSSISKMVSERDTVGDYRGSQRIFRVALTILLVLGLTLSVLLFAFAQTIANFCGMPAAGRMLMTLAPALLFTSVNCAIRGYFQGKKNMAPTAVSQVVEQFFNSLFTVTFVWAFYRMTVDNTPLKLHKISNAAAGSAVGTVAGAVFAAAFLIYVFHLTKRRRARELRRSGPSQLTTGRIVRMIAGYSIPAVVSAVASNAAPLLDASMCSGRMKDSGLPEATYMAYYGQYNTNYLRIVSVMTAIATAIMVALIPSVSSADARHDRRALKHTIVSGYKALFVFTVPCLAGLTALAHPAIALIFFNVRQGGGQYLALWAWTNILVAIISVQSGILIGLGKPVAGPVNMLVGMSAKLLLNYFLVAQPALNMHGAAIGSLVGWLITVVLDDAAINRAVGFRVRYVRLLFKPAAVSVVMGFAARGVFELFNRLFASLLHAKGKIALLVCNDAAVLIAVAAGAAVYFTLLILWNGLHREEILRFPKGERLYALLVRVPIFRRSLGWTPKPAREEPRIYP